MKNGCRGSEWLRSGNCSGNSRIKKIVRVPGRSACKNQDRAYRLTLPCLLSGAACLTGTPDTLGLRASGDRHPPVIQRFRLKIEVVRSLTAQAANHGPGSF